MQIRQPCIMARDIRVEQVERPEIGDHDVLVRVKASASGLGPAHVSAGVFEVLGVRLTAGASWVNELSGEVSRW